MDNPQSILTFSDIRAGDRVKVIAKCVDFSFFYEETGVVTRNSHKYLGIIVKFDKPRKFRDGTVEVDFNFNPTDLEIVEKRFIDKEPVQLTKENIERLLGYKIEIIQSEEGE